MNTLLASVNWRAGIVQIFRDALKGLDSRNRIVTIDTDPLAAGIYFSDKHYMVPLYVDSGYLDALKEICMAERINFIIPQTDRDCNYFSEHSETVESWGSKILMPVPKKVRILNDKLLSRNFFAGHGILTPEVYTENEFFKIKKYPVIVKPRKDSGSAGVKIVRDEKELESILKYADCPIVEEFIVGKEFTVDGAANLDHSLIGVVPRERIMVKGGISVKGVTFYDRGLIETAKKVAELIEPTGFFCMQFMKRDDDYYLIEVNGRMGSGLVLSIEAGLDIGEIMTAYSKGKSIHFEDNFFETDLYMMQYLNPIFRKKEDLLS